MATLPVRCSMVSIVALRHLRTTPEMLLMHRAGGELDGIWSYVGGHVEAGETGWETALRELREETGLVPEALYATSFCEQIYLARSDTVEIVPAFVALIAAEAEVHLNGEHSAFRWVPFAEASERVPFGSQRDLLAQVEREFLVRPPNPLLRIAFD